MTAKKLKKLTLDDATVLTGESASELELLKHLEGDHEGVRFVDGHCTIDGDLLLDQPQLGLVVSGNLTIKGSVINRASDWGPPLIVGGDLKAKNVIGGGSEIIVLGSAQVANTVYGHYNHGELRIDGDLKAKAWLNSDHSMWVSGTLEAATAGLHDGDFVFSESEEVFHKGLIVDGRLDHDALLARILDGKPPISPKAKPPRVIVLEELKKLAKDGEVTSLDLRGKGLTDYPDSIEALALERLYIPNFSDMPDSIGAMQTLRELYLDGWAYEPVSKGIFELSQLQVLHFDYTQAEASVPAGISALDKLEVLSMIGHPVTVPADLGKLTALRELDISGISSMQMYKFPTEVLKLAQLEVLICGDQQFANAPDLSGFRELHTLSFGDALGSMKGVLDLSALPKLKRLNWSGGSPTTSAPYPAAAKLNAVRGLEQLEVLNLERWREEQGRPNFSFPDDIFLGLPNLRVVGLDICELTKLPESLFTLNHLKVLSLKLNHDLPKSELERVHERWPGILLNVASWRFKVWSHEVVTRTWESSPTGPLHYRGLSIPVGARVECWARGKANGYGKYHPWVLIGDIAEGGDGSLPIEPGFSAAKQGESYEFALRLFPAANGERPTVDMIWLD